LFVRRHQFIGWDKPLQVPSELRQEVLEVNHLMISWAGRVFQGQCTVRSLASDSSNLAWGGLDTSSGLSVQDFWREKSGLHINVKELEAAIHTIKSLAKPNETVHLSVDNSVAFSYLRKGGGRLPHFNALMRDLWAWCMERSIALQPQLVKSSEQAADSLSRPLQDKEDYSLDRNLFLQLLAKFQPWVVPQVDMFANPGNAQLPQFCSRAPHWAALLVDALHCPLGGVPCCYACPPWTIIHHWLNRLKDNPTLRCLIVVPYWVSATWWPLILKLHVTQSPCIIVPPFQGMFRNCWGEAMPPPRWPLLCTLLSGSAFKEGKFHLKESMLI
jgi:hypothetical protein